MKRVAIYARVSTQEQAENGNSLEFQIEKLKAYCQLHELKIVGEYIDAGVSGAKFSRPALDRLKNDIEKIDIVLVYKIDRLSRTIKDTMLLIEDIFKPNNVDLISLSENFDTSQAVGMAMIAVISTFAQLERETIKERMIAGKIQAVKNGKYINRPPFGYIKKDGKILKDEKTEACMKFIFDCVLKRKSLSEIVSILQISEYSKLRKWNVTAIGRMVKNNIYCGHTETFGTIQRNTHERYITEEQQKYMLELIAERKTHSSKSAKNKIPALFRGIISCPKCYHRLTPTNKKSSNGDKLIYYRCINCLKNKQSDFSVPERKFEKKLLDFLKYDFKIEFEKSEIEKKDYTKILNNLENKKIKLQRAWLNELLTDEELRKLQNEINEQIKVIEKEKNDYNLMVENSKKQKNISGIISNFENLYTKMNNNEKIEFLNMIIKEIKIKVEPKKVNLINKYEITISDIIFR